MVPLNCTLLNFSEKDLFFLIFENYGNDFEYRYNGVFRRTQPPLCSDCGSGVHSKIDDLVITLIQRKIWAVLKLAGISAHYVVNHVKRVVSSGRRFFPRGKDTILRAFNDSVEETDFPVLENFNIIRYGEQYPKRGRTQKYCLTLLDRSYWSTDC